MKYYLRDRFRAVLKLNDPPHKLALAFALGVFVAFTPTIGLHLLTCLFFAWVFRVSRLVVLTASFINNPWTIVPIYGFCLWIGIKITGSDFPSPAIAWNEPRLTDFYIILKPYLWPFVIGTITVGTAAGLASYALFYYLVVIYRKREDRPGWQGQT